MTIADRNMGIRILNSAALLLFSFCTINLWAEPQLSSSPQEYCPASPATPRFEVATVKAAQPNSREPIIIHGLGGGRVVAENSTLQELLEVALGLQGFQIKNLAGWMVNTRYDIVGIPSDTSPDRQLMPTDPKAPLTGRQRAMLRALVCERFKIAMTTGETSGRVLVLRQIKTVPQLMETSDPDKPAYVVIKTQSSGGNGEILGSNASMDYLAARLSRYLQVPVRNETGLSGAYDFDVTSGGVADSEDADVIPEGVKRLGLRLVSERGKVVSVTVLHAESPDRD
jgi:uncharacterized protein (TIGR03435 family)